LLQNEQRRISVSPFFLTINRSGLRVEARYRSPYIDASTRFLYTMLHPFPDDVIEDAVLFGLIR
jgi:hypothetical protein